MLFQAPCPPAQELSTTAGQWQQLEHPPPPSTPGTSGWQHPGCAVSGAGCTFRIIRCSLLWSVLSCWRGHAGVGPPQDPSWTPAWVPLPIPLVARPCWAALVPSRGHGWGGGIPNSHRFNSSPAGAEARLGGAAAGMLALVTGGWHGGDMATAGWNWDPRALGWAQRVAKPLWAPLSPQGAHTAMPAHQSLAGDTRGALNCRQ